jgi:hypothetical protein
MKKRNLVLTYSTNQTELTSLTYPFLERYCEHHNLDLIITREPNTYIRNKFSELDVDQILGGEDRLFAYDLFDIYDRILWIGSDVLVQPYAPNIFDIVPDNHIGGYVEHKRGESHHAGDICGDCFNAFGVHPDNYINIDVMLVDKSLKDIYNYNDTELVTNINKGKWAYQDYFNFYIKQNNIPLYDLGYKWNCMVSKYLYTNTPLPADWNFLHVTGIDSNSRIKLIREYLTQTGMI